MSRFLLSFMLLCSILPLSAVAAEEVDNYLNNFNPQRKSYKLEYSLSHSQNRSLFNKYCRGEVTSHRAPKPRYSNALVRKAATNIASTDKRAKEALKEKAIKEMQISVEEAKESATSLKSSQNTAVASAAEEILEDLNNSSEFDDGVESKSKKIMTLLNAEIKAITNNLIEPLEQDLEGVDREKYKKELDQFSTELKNDLEKIRFSVLSERNKQLQSASEGLASQLNREAIKKLAETISSETQLKSEENPSVNGYIYMKEEADRLVLEAQNEESSLSDLSYSIGYVLNYYETEDMEHTAKSIESSKSLKKQQANTVAADIIKRSKAVEDTLQAADENNEEDIQTVRIASSELAYRLDRIERVVEKQELIDAATSYKKEHKKFRRNTILKKVSEAQAMIEQGSWAGSYSSTLGAIRDLKDADFSLGEAAKGYQASLVTELKKRNVERIKTATKELKDELAGDQGLEEQEIYWLADTVYNYMRRAEEFGFQQAKENAKKFVTSFEDVLQARALQELAKKRIEDVKPGMHYYFYGHVWKHYKGASQKPSHITWNAHKFLVQLCGEYRDRATMIEAKLKWVANGLYILPNKEEAADTVVTAQTKNVWSKVPADWYYPYIYSTKSLWEARRRAQDRYIKVGTYTHVDNPVKGTTVCETKYIFAEYVAKNKEFDNLEAFNEGYDSFKQGCPVADRKDYYDFRGDSNFKHYSPESNGMIWYANNLARACRSSNRIKSSTKNYRNSDCEHYFKNPFNMRYSGARALLASWLLRDSQHDDVFGESGDMVSIYSHRKPHLAPYSFGFDQNSLDYHFEFDEKWEGIPLENGWLKGDMGYNQYTGLKANPSDEAQDKAFTLISNAVDRHTDWYASGYNDGNGFVRDQATSPFVASSYVMSSSDMFTSCGVTVQCPDDGLKRWMFVFRIKGENWYGPDRIAKGEPINFDRHWFDETSFGFTHLADSEHAWDRLGTALEEEFDSILYLVNVPRGGGVH